MGKNAISRVEIRTKNGSAPIGPITVRGGLNDDVLQIARASADPIDAVVNIYATPNDQIFGIKTPTVRLVHRYSVRITQRVFITIPFINASFL